MLEAVCLAARRWNAKLTRIVRLCKEVFNVPDETTTPDGLRPLLLPPPYTAHWCAQGDVMAQACALAPVEGAGTLVWHMSNGTGRAGRLDFAVVLEPEQPLAQARLAFILGMAALGDALGAHCPPETSVTFGWPDAVMVDQGRLGGMRFVTAEVGEGAGKADVPAWMVLGVELILDRDHLTAPGTKPDSVSLKEEGFNDPLAVLESFASYLMLHFDRWTHEGFDPVMERYRGRLADSTLDAAGGLVLDDGTRTLAAGLSGPAAWRDTDGPRL